MIWHDIFQVSAITGLAGCTQYTDNGLTMGINLDACIQSQLIIVEVNLR